MQARTSKTEPFSSRVRCHLQLHLDATKSKVQHMEFLLIEEIQVSKREFLMKRGNLSEADATFSEFWRISSTFFQSL